MKKITYVLTISELFPKGHFREGNETGFVKKISAFEKIHTIRGNYDLWAKRAEKINAGIARLSVRVWTGKPYRSKQREVFAFENIGVEKFIYKSDLYNHPFIGKSYFHSEKLIDVAKNDGLEYRDFVEWFRGVKTNEKMVIIHFTNFRYSEKTNA